jgi:predicted transcriptional regulator
MDLDAALKGLLFLLKNYPLVLRWKLEPEQRAALAPNLWDDLQEPPELLWHIPQELEGQTLDLESMAIEFFNPFLPALRLAGVHRSVIGIISPVKSLDLVVSSLITGVVSDWREARRMAISELERRGLIEPTEDGRMRFTERGRRMLVTEPLSDCLSCRCRIEEVMEYELGGEDD